MNERERIKRRMRQLDSSESSVFHNLLFSFVYHTMLSFMVVLALILGGLIVTKTEYTAVKQQVASVFSKMKIADWIPFEHWFVKGDVPVVTVPIVNQLEGNYFSNDSNVVSAVSNGIVVYVNQSDTHGYQVIVQNDNGILVTYSKLNEIQVKLEDRIFKGTALGTYQEMFYMDFLDGETYLSYDETMAKN